MYFSVLYCVVKSKDITGVITELSIPGFSFWGSFEKLRLGFELLMFYYVEPSSVFLKPSFILKPGLESSVIPPYMSTKGLGRRFPTDAFIFRVKENV